MSTSTPQIKHLLAALVVVWSLLAFVACGEDNGPDLNGPTGNNDVCRAASEADLCDEHDFECGVHEVIDNCEDEREIDCGDEETVCEEHETCGGGDQEGVCGCTPETDEQLCDEHGVECGPLDEAVDETVVDSCGDEREVESCGDEQEVCPEDETCGGAGEPGICGCVPETSEELCDEYGVECGYLEDVVDSCGEEHDEILCGEEEEVCGEHETCGGGDQEGVCGCTPETDDELCEDHGIECGPLEDVTDSCGEERLVDSCGQESEVCGPHETCGGGEEDGVCGCTPTTCEAEGILCGEISDDCGGTIDCDLFCADEVAVGNQHACAVGSETVRCWGRNDDGQLGVGDTEDKSNPTQVINDPDNPDSAIQQVESVTAGTSHSCALLNDGNVRCWGYNEFGQLGDGDSNDSPTPSTPTASDTVAVDAGALHTCAISEFEEFYEDDTGNAVTQDVERIQCWGHNNRGQVGNPGLELNPDSTITDPHLVHREDDALEDHVALDVVVGEFHSCGLFRGPFEQKPFDETNEDDLKDSVWCWGDNRFGQIDPSDLSANYHDHYSDYGYSPVYGFDRDATHFPRYNQPEKVAERPTDDAGDLHVTAGADHTCVHNDSTEETTCYGTFAHESTGSRTCDATIQVYDGTEEDDDNEFHVYSSVEQQAQYCSIMPDFGADMYPFFDYTTNDDDSHDLETIYLDGGYDTDYTVRIADSQEISEVFEDEVESLQMTSGANHMCAILEDHDDIELERSNIYCIGNNWWGQLGEGTNNNWTQFREVAEDPDDPGFIEAVQLSLGHDLSCALMANHNIKCWGSNSRGQIGDPDLAEDEAQQPRNVQLSIADD